MLDHLRPDPTAPEDIEVPVALSPRPEIRLSYQEARQAPCMSCPTSPCCTHLLLRRFALEDIGDVDYLLYLSNFEGILPSIDEAGKVRVYLYQPCGHLDVPSGLCRVHGTPDQPSVCVHYNAHACQYRYGMTVDLNPRQPLMDRSRVRWYIEHVTFDDERKVAERPDWSDVLEAFSSMPLERQPSPDPGPDPVDEEWRAIVLGTKPSSDTGYRDLSFADPEVRDPCVGCGAWCCHTLIFGHDLPENTNQFDFFRYCLGFPSVELGISEESWAVVVRTTCRHLQGNRCSVYGTDERPLRCGYYDALKCVYRTNFGSPRPDGLIRVNREHFPVLAASVVFDEQGQVRRVPSNELLRHRIELTMRARAG
jgi:hypothetical protein